MTEGACCEPGDCETGRLRIGAVLLAAGEGARHRIGLEVHTHGGRAAVLRRECESQLGADVFGAVYAYLKSKAADAYAMDYDTRMRDDLLGLMGPAMLRFWPLVDQLIFCEECGNGKAGGDDIDDIHDSGRRSDLEPSFENTGPERAVESGHGRDWHGASGPYPRATGASWLDTI